MKVIVINDAPIDIDRQIAELAKNKGIKSYGYKVGAAVRNGHQVVLSGFENEENKDNKSTKLLMSGALFDTVHSSIRFIVLAQSATDADIVVSTDEKDIRVGLARLGIIDAVTRVDGDTVIATGLMLKNTSETLKSCQRKFKPLLAVCYTGNSMLGTIKPGMQKQAVQAGRNLMVIGEWDDAVGEQ